MSASSAPASEFSASSVMIRRARPEDAEACGKICYEAFRAIATAHNFTPDIPSAEVARGFLSMMFGNDGFFCVVAERDGRVIASNCLDERNPIAGIGPITVDPAAQNRSVGRKLMEAVLTRAAERNFLGIRLVQAGYHTRSLSLYTKLGFTVREPLACMLGPAIGAVPSGYQVRPARIEDLGACDGLARTVHGHDRSGELRDAIQQGAAVVAEAHGRIVGYATSVALFGHAVAETNGDLEAIISAAHELHPPGFLVPTRNSSLFRWCLNRGFRMTQPMNLMSVGLYNEPAGAFLPSVTF